jgi:hypothetical protein
MGGGGMGEAWETIQLAQKPKNKCPIVKPKPNKFTYFCFVYEVNGRYVKMSLGYLLLYTMFYNKQAFWV